MNKQVTKCSLIYLRMLTGVVQGMVTGVRGLCSGLGPAFYGLIFYLYHVDIASQDASNNKPELSVSKNSNDTVTSMQVITCNIINKSH